MLTEINMLSSTTTSNTYGIPTTLLKQFRDTCSESLLFVLNNCIEKSTFDKDLKYADITTHKKDDTTNTANYLHISVLPSVSKIFERILLKQIGSYMERYLSNFFGYRKGYSAQYALISMFEKCCISLDNQGFAGAVLMDLSKAFDTLNHELIIAKIHAYGFDKDALQLIKSYLSNRWQRTKINASYSSWSELISGVLQGSVLGPLLFNIYIYIYIYIYYYIYIYQRLILHDRKHCV